MANIKSGNAEKRKKRFERAEIGERLTNGYMLCLTYGLIGIVLLEIIKRQYNIITPDAWEFTGKLCIVFGIIFALAAAVMVFLGCFRKISASRSKTHTVMFVISSLISFFLSWQIRQPIASLVFNSLPQSEKLSMNPDYGIWDFLANVKPYRDAKYIEYGIVAFLVVAFVIYAIRLARVEKKK